MSFDGNTQIVDLFEVSGLDPEAIASALGGMDVLSIKAVLFQSSAKYREATKTKQKLDYTQEEAADAKRIALSIMQHSDDDRLRAKIALRVLDDKKGRLEPQATGNSLRPFGGANINITLVQELKQQLARGQEALAPNTQTRPAANSTIDLDANPTPIPDKEQKMLQEARDKMRLRAEAKVTA